MPAKTPSVFISSDDMNETILGIINSYDGSLESYRTAFLMYDVNFFEGESDAFKQALARALMTKFAGYKNNFWNQLASNPGQTI